MKEPKLGIIEAHRATEDEIFDYFLKMDKRAIKGDRWLYIPGSTKMPLLVAHVDTVHWKLPKKIYYDEEKGHLMSPQGIGSDDRAGIYAIATLHANLDPTPGILLCDEEEKGGGGAWSAAYDLVDELRKYPFFLELDRKGDGECVFYNDEGKEFVEFIEGFGFREDWGLFSDITVLGEELKKCSVNVSVGYEKQHTVNEYLVIQHLLNTLHKVQWMCNECEAATTPLHFKLPKPKKANPKVYGNQQYNASDWTTDLPADISDYDVNDPYPFAADVARAQEFDAECEMCHSYGDTYYTNLTYGWCCIACYNDLERAQLVARDDSGLVRHNNEFSYALPAKGTLTKIKNKIKKKSKRKRKRERNQVRRYKNMATVTSIPVVGGESNDPIELYPERNRNARKQAGGC